MEECYINANPATGIKFRSKKQKVIEANKLKRRTFSPAEMLRLTAAVNISRWRDKVENTWFLRLMMWTGARPGGIGAIDAGGC